MQLSKSDYMLFLRHPAWLWLKKHDKDKLPPVDAATQAVFDTGHAFEPYAEQQFTNGVTLGFNDYKEYLSLPERTSKALEDGVKTIFQGRFEYGQLTFICDIINVVEDKTVDLIEIKSSTSAKPEHILDLAFQMIVLEGCGYTVRNVSVMHVNNQYVRKDEIKADEIVSTTDVTEDVKEKKAFTIGKSGEALDILALKQCPDTSPTLTGLGAFKEWLEIYKTLDPQPEKSIFELGSLNAKALEIFTENGISKIDEIPENLSISSGIDKQLRAYRNHGPIIDKLRIKQFLGSLKFPLYFFDYETLSSLVPYFDGMRPYAQYPFQYSLHILDSPDADLRHLEYLHADNSNPAESVVNAMRSHFGDSGSIVTWNMGFEKGCNDALADFVPESSEFLKKINERIVDLMVPFSSGAYVDHRFKGSASIKAVLPILVPELSYKVLGIQDGQTAQRAWMEVVLDEKRPDEKEQVLSDLIEYCGLDTLAMVEIYIRLDSL